MKLLLLAGRKTGFNSLKRLLETDRHQVVGVISQDYPGMVNDGIPAEAFAVLLEEHKIPFWKTDRLDEEAFQSDIRALAPDLGLSIGWRRLVREPFLSIPTQGFINFHTSDLPRYRGFASTSWAILRGEESIAVTAHRMLDGRADDGEVYLKERIPITERTDIGSLFKEIETVLPSMVERLVDGIAGQTLKPVPQNEADCLLSFPRHPDDGWIDWNRPAVEIDRLVRSVTRPYPGAFTCRGLQKVIVWKGHVAEAHPPFVGVPGHVIGPGPGGSIRVLTGQGIYVIEEISLDEDTVGLAPAERINGVQQRLGFTPGALFERLRKTLKQGN